jgi:hypothetical protein
MQNSSHAKGFLVKSGEVGGGQFVDDSLAVQPSSHNMIVSKCWKVLVSECNRCIDDMGVWDLNSGDDAAKVYHHDEGIEIYGRCSKRRKAGKYCLENRREKRSMRCL